MTQQSAFSPRVRRRLCLRLRNELLLCGLDLDGVLLEPLKADSGEALAADSGKDNGHERRRDAVADCFLEHALLDPPLLEAEVFLARPLLLLLALLFLGLGEEPVPHGVLGALPLRRWSRHAGEVGGHWRCNPNRVG